MELVPGRGGSLGEVLDRLVYEAGEARNRQSEARNRQAEAKNRQAEAKNRSPGAAKNRSPGAAKNRAGEAKNRSPGGAKNKSSGGAKKSPGGDKNQSPAEAKNKSPGGAQNRSGGGGKGGGGGTGGGAGHCSGGGGESGGAEGSDTTGGSARDTEGGASSAEARTLHWHLANLEYGCAASLGNVSLCWWDQVIPHSLVYYPIHNLTLPSITLPFCLWGLLILALCKSGVRLRNIARERLSLLVGSGNYTKYTDGLYTKGNEHTRTGN